MENKPVRRLAVDRKLVEGRQLVVGRQLVGFVNDGKIHAVLDTNVILNAMWAISKGADATRTEQDCLTIMRAVDGGKITLGINSILHQEYIDKVRQHFATGRLDSSAVNYVMRIVNRNCVHVRMLVDRKRMSRDPGDDMLFNGLSARFLISDNLKDVAPHRLLPGIDSPYFETITPTGFVDRLGSLGLP